MSVRETLLESRMEAMERRQSRRSPTEQSSRLVGVFDGYDAQGNPIVSVNGARVEVRAIASGTAKIGERIALTRNGNEFVALWRSRGS